MHVRFAFCKQSEIARVQSAFLPTSQLHAPCHSVLCLRAARMDRLKQHLRDQGITAADLPKAIVFHEVLGAAMAVGFWSACYTLQPSRTMFRPLARRASSNTVARRSYDAAVQSAQKTMAKLPWLQKIGDPGRLTTSLAESICVRASIKPATFPFKIWASYKFVQMTKRHQRALM